MKTKSIAKIYFDPEAFRKDAKKITRQLDRFAEKYGDIGLDHVVSELTKKRTSELDKILKSYNSGSKD